MRFNRVVFILLAFYFVFLGGSAYYFLAFPVRILHHALVTALLAWWLFRRFRQGKGLPSTPLNKPIYAAVIVWFVSAMTSLDPRMALENLWFPLTHLIFFFVLVDLFQRGRQRLVMDSQFMMAAMIIVITGLELASWYFGLGIIPGTEIGWASVLGPDIPLPLVPLRVSLAMNISTLLAGYAAPLITLTIGWALTAQQRNFRTVLWVMVGLLSVVLLLTFSRGGLLSLVAGVGTLLVMRLLQSPRMAENVITRRIPTR